MKNDSFFSRIPLPVLVVVWLGLVGLGAVLVYSVFFNKPADSTTQVPAQKTPVVQTNKPIQPAPTQTNDQQPLTPAQPTKAPTISPVQDTSFGYGLQADYLTGDVPNTVKQAKRLRMDWIKQQVRWGVFSPAADQFDWTGFDLVIDAASQQGLKVMLSIVTAPEWSRPSAAGLGIEGPPDDLNAYAKFVGEVVDRYKGKVHAIEVWNEQNIDAEWKTNPQVVSPEKYVEMLRLAYEIIKAKDPNIVVISGALAPTGFFVGGCTEAGCDDGPYLRRMVEAGALNYVDCVGVHANGYNVPPDKTHTEGYSDPTATFNAPSTNPIPSWYFRSTLELYRDTVNNQKPLCVTEFGWGSSEGFDFVLSGYDYVKDNTLQEQGAYIVQAFDLMKEWGYVKMAFLFNLDYAQKSPNGVQDRTAPWSIFDQSGAARPAFEQLRLHMKSLYPDK